MRDRNAEFVSQQQVKEIGRRRKQADSMDFFNLITGPELLESLEALLPEYRERKFPPTVTLAMFLGQILRADSSCRNAANEAIINQLLQGSEAVSANTGGYCQARERLPTDLVRELARRCGRMMNQRTSNGWLWRGRHVKLTDGTTTLMPDTEPNQAKYPQHGSQEQGAGFPIARPVAVMSLANGAVLDLAMGPYQGKGTGEYGLFRELLDCFVEGDVMLADSYYCYEVGARLNGRHRLVCRCLIDFEGRQRGIKHRLMGLQELNRLRSFGRPEIDGSRGLLVRHTIGIGRQQGMHDVRHVTDVIDLVLASRDGLIGVQPLRDVSSDLIPKRWASAITTLSSSSFTEL